MRIFTIPEGTVKTIIDFYARRSSSGNIGDACVYSEIQIEYGPIRHEYVPYGKLAFISTGNNLIDPSKITLHACTGTVEDGSIDVTATTGSASNGIKLGWFPPGTYTLNADSFGGTTIYPGTRLISNLQLFSSWTENQYYPSILKETDFDAYYKNDIRYPFTFTAESEFYLAFCASDTSDKTFTATGLRLVAGSSDRPYEVFAKEVSYINLNGNELYAFDSTYRDILTVNAKGNVILEKRCGKAIVDGTTLPVAGKGTDNSGNSYLTAF